MPPVTYYRSELGGTVLVSDPPTPQMAGAIQSKTVSGLSPNTTYYFAIKAADETPNWSAVSNSPSAQTIVGPDITPPVIQNIQITIGQPGTWPSQGSVYFQSQVVDQDGVTGTIRVGKTTGYELGSKTTGYYSPGGLMWGFSAVYLAKY